MAGGRSRTQKLAAKASKRKVAVAERQHAERFAASLAGRVAAAAVCPLERCVRHEAMFEIGVGTIVVARQLSSGLIAAGFFLVDVWCLGAKEVLFKELGRSEFDDQMADLVAGGRIVDITPACARSLLAGAVAYAAASTFQPAKPYAIVQRLFGDAPASECDETFVFGHDGLPTFFDRSGDPPGRGREIVATLERVHGDDGWDVMVDTSLGSPFGQLKVMAGFMRDDPGFSGFRRELENAAKGSGPVIEHEPAPREAANPGSEPEFEEDGSVKPSA